MAAEDRVRRMNAEDFRKAGYQAVDDIATYFESVKTRRVTADIEPGYLKKLLPDGPPEDGQSWDDIHADIGKIIEPGITHWQSPDFLAFFPNGNSHPGILAEMYSAAFTGPAFSWICSPAITELETVMLDWLAKLLNLPEHMLSEGSGGGVIQGSASEANAASIVAGRERYLQRTTMGLSSTERAKEIALKRGKLVALASEQAHSCAEKGARVGGTLFRSVPVRKEDEYAITGDGLRKVLKECEEEGLEPYHITVCLGTTGTCAVDRLDEIEMVLKDYPDVWLHMDAAWAGTALICPEHHYLTKHFGCLDSFSTNLHKWLLTNFDCSPTYVKCREEWTDAFSITPSYLKNDYTDGGLVLDYRDWQVPLGRRFRSLKIWFIMRYYGVSGLQAHIRRTIKLGEHFTTLIRSRPDIFEIITPARFCLTVFRVLPPALGPVSSAVPHIGSEQEKQDGVHLDLGNQISREVYETLNASGKIFFTSTTIDGVYTLRVVCGTENHTEHSMTHAFEVILQESENARRRKLLEFAT